MRNRSTRFALVLAGLLAIQHGIAGVCSAGMLFIPTTQVQATDVFSGPSFTVSGYFGPNDVVSVRGVGVVDLASGDFKVNAAGVIVAPQTTNTGNHPGELYFAAAAVRPDVPVGAVLIGNDSLGFSPLFPDDTATGLGSPTPPTDISVINRSLGDIFGPGFSGISSGTVLQLRVNDENTFDNTGSFLISSVPEPSSLVLAALAGLLLAAPALRRFGTNAA